MTLLLRAIAVGASPATTVIENVFSIDSPAGSVERIRIA